MPVTPPARTEGLPPSRGEAPRTIFQADVCYTRGTQPLVRELFAAPHYA